MKRKEILDLYYRLMSLLANSSDKFVCHLTGALSEELKRTYNLTEEEINTGVIKE